MSSVIEIDLCSLCVEGNSACLQAYLTSEDFDPRSLFDKDAEGLIPYQLSILNGHPMCMDSLLGTNVDQEVTFQGLHPVHLVMSLAAFKEKHSLVVQMVQVLTNHKQDIGQRDRLGRTALHLVCMNGPPDLVLGFISAGLKLETKDFAGKMPIHYAIEFDQPECLKLIIQEGGSDMFFCTDARGDKPIHVAVRSAAWECFEVLLSFAYEEMLNELNEFEQTPAEVARNCGLYQEFCAATQGVKTKNCTRTAVFTDELCYFHAGFSQEIRNRFDWFKFLLMQPENPVRLERILGCSISGKKTKDTANSEAVQGALPDSEGHLGSESLEGHGELSGQSDAVILDCATSRGVQASSYISNGPAGSLMTDEFSELGWQVTVKPASIADILRVHEYSYVKRLQDFISKLTPGALPSRFDVDTRVSSESFQSALHAAGAVLEAVDSVLQGHNKNAFCCVRPPGHHVGPFGAVASEEDPSLTSNGFCLFNNVAVGAAYAKYMYSKEVQKVAIIDFDVHHGNGTEAIVRNLQPSKLKMSLNLPMVFGSFEYDSYKPWLSEDDAKNVLFISSHAYGRQGPGFFYPASGTACTGEELFPGGVLNIPLQKSTDSLTFRKYYRKTVFPRLLAFAPDLILLSAGFDAHGLDEINHGFIDLDEDDFRWVTEEIIRIANTSCKGKIVSVLEGGYGIKGGTVSALGLSVAAHVRALLRANQEHFTERSEVEDAEKMSLKSALGDRNRELKRTRNKYLRQLEDDFLRKFEEDAQDEKNEDQLAKEGQDVLDQDSGDQNSEEENSEDISDESSGQEDKVIVE